MQGTLMLEGVVLYPGNREGVVAFYRDKLGLPVLQEEEHVTHFEAGSIRLAIHRREEGEGAPPDDGFIVFGTDNLDVTCAELRR